MGAVPDERICVFLVDLSHAYERMGRKNQAVNVFAKAIPHIEDEVGKRVRMWEQHGSMGRPGTKCFSSRS
jgi:hypothetical protein